MPVSACTGDRHPQLRAASLMLQRQACRWRGVISMAPEHTLCTSRGRKYQSAAPPRDHKATNCHCIISNREERVRCGE